VITAVALSTTNTDSIAASNWSSPVKIAENGADGVGITDVVEQYYLSTSRTQCTGGSWSQTMPSWQSGRYVWTRTKTTWDNGNITYTDPILAAAINDANERAENAENAVTALDRGLDSRSIFDRLTDNGQKQVLEWDNGNLYVNATYIATGILASKTGDSYWNLDKGLLHLVGDLIMVMSGYKSPAKHYVQMGTFSSYNSVGNSATLRGLKLFTDGEYNSNGTNDNVLALVAHDNVYNYYGSSNTPMTSAIISSDKNLVIRALQATDLNRYIQLRESSIYFRSDDGMYRGNGASMAIYDDSILVKMSKDGGNYTAVQVKNTSDGVRATSVDFTSDVKIHGTLSVTNSKNRIVETEDYGTRKLYCYETATPYFGDIGSGTTDADGTCVVLIDDLTQQAVGSDGRYHVFLQKCGEGDLWVSEKHREYFVVEGTPSLGFDWELKAIQPGFSNERLEPEGSPYRGDDGETNFNRIYAEELNYSANMEALYE
jgi:hypothetical protein